MISYIPLNQYAIKMDQHQKENISILNDAIGINTDLTRKEERSLQWLAEWEKETVENIASAIKKSVKRKLSPDHVIVKRTSVKYCSCCMRDFDDNEMVYYVVVDNNMICTKCNERVDANVELRIYKK